MASEEHCINSFSAALAPDKDLAEAVQRCVAVDPDGKCQGHRVSASSPGPVLPEELICRSVFSPPQFNKSAPFDLNETLFEDVFTQGSSTQRANLNVVGAEESLHHRGEQKAEVDRQKLKATGKDVNRLYVGFIPVRVDEIRAIAIPDMPAAARARVYDTASPGDEMHADVMCDQRDCATSSKGDKLKRKQIRIALFNVANGRKLYVSPHLTQEQLASLNLGPFRVHEKLA